MSGSATSWVRLWLGAQIEILFADAARPPLPRVLCLSVLVTVAGTCSPEEPPLASHPGCRTFQEDKPDGHRVQQRPPQARTQMPTHLTRSSKRLQQLLHPLSLGNSFSQRACPLRVCSPHVRPSPALDVFPAGRPPWSSFWGSSSLHPSPFSRTVSFVSSLAHM